MVGWQLCSNASYPFPVAGFSLPPPGPVHLSLRLLKLDRGLHHYLLEAAYSLLAQVQGNTKIYFHLCGYSLCSVNFRVRSTWPQYVVSVFKGFTENDCRPLCVFFLSSLTQLCPNLFFTERHLAAQRGLHPPPPGHTSVLHPQGRVSGPELQPSQAAAEDYPSSENHPYTRSVTEEHQKKNTNFCLGLNAEN